MPNKPTDKKLTFVEWLAKKYNCSIKRSKDIIRIFADKIIADEIHSGHCIGKLYPCILCELQTMLSEYHKYFKQK